MEKGEIEVLRISETLETDTRDEKKICDNYRAGRKTNVNLNGNPKITET